MTHYTFTCRDRDVVLVTPIHGGFRTEADAIEAGRALAKRHEAVEVWQGLTLVTRLGQPYIR